MTGPAREVPAILLASSTLAEADVLAVILTPDFGKLRAAARGARRSRKRFASGLQPGACGTATLARSRTASTGGLWRLDGFVPDVPLTGLGRDLQAFAFVAYLCELTDIVVSQPAPDRLVFAALWSALTRVVAGSASPAVLRAYELELARAVGHAPAVMVCCVCGRPPSPGLEVPYDGERGGILCPEHAGSRARVEVPSAAVTVAAALLANEPTAGEQLDQAPAAVRRAVRDIAWWALRGLVSRPLKSSAFLQQLRASAPEP